MLIQHATSMGHIRCITFFTFSNYVYQFTHAHPGNPVAIIATHLDDATTAGETPPASH